MAGLCATLIVSFSLASLSAEAQEPEADTGVVSESDVAELQVALDRCGFGVGFVDNKEGRKTRGALADFRTSSGDSQPMPPTNVPPFISYTVTEDDTLMLGSSPDDWEERAETPVMAYETIDDLLSEKFHVSRNYLKALNPEVEDWDADMTGKSVIVPNVLSRAVSGKAARIDIDCRDYRLRVYDEDNALIASFPCSIARSRSKVPTVEMKIVAFAPNPTYTFDPVNFPESPRAQEIGRKLIVQAGPRNPVGVYWMSLSLPGYGIHGTDHPDTVGSSESHGCFRLTNWDIVVLAKLADVGTPVAIINTDEP